MRLVCKSIVLMAFLIIASVCSAQNRSAHWCFGDSAHIYFDSSGPQAMPPSGFYGHEAVSTISDKEGNLLMYSNGLNIWDAAHNVMPNGGDLLTVPWDPGFDLFYSETQGSIILPSPGDSLRYYIFSKQGYIAFQSQHFFYSIVNLSLRSGLGDVELGQKAVSLWDSTMLNGLISSEKTAAVKHGNGRDWWLFLYSSTGGPALYDSTLLRYLITPEGIKLDGYQAIPRYSQEGDFYGEMNFSQNGDKIALGGSDDILRVFEFDRCSGLVGNAILVDTLNNTVYSNEFSPDGNMLYISKEYNLTTDLHGKIIQYDLNNIGQLGYKQIIYSMPDTVQNGQLQLGPDGKVYLSTVKGLCVWPICNEDTSSPWATNLSVINEPNLSGNACNFQKHAISTGGRKLSYGLPNQPNYDLGALVGSPCDTLGISSSIEAVLQDKILLYPNPVASGGVITLNLTMHDRNVVFRIFDLNGQIVLEGNGLPEQLKAKGFNAGLYHLVILTERAAYHARFVVE